MFWPSTAQNQWMRVDTRSLTFSSPVGHMSGFARGGKMITCFSAQRGAGGAGWATPTPPGPPFARGGKMITCFFSPAGCSRDWLGDPPWPPFCSGGKGNQPSSPGSFWMRAPARKSAHASTTTIAMIASVRKSGLLKKDCTLLSGRYSGLATSDPSFTLTG